MMNTAPTEENQLAGIGLPKPFDDENGDQKPIEKSENETPSLKLELPLKVQKGFDGPMANPEIEA
jgi:hypothetical protein